MEYQEQFILDFARRTRANLEYIEAAEQRGETVFEFTQLANSLLGLLVFPREHYMRSIPAIPLEELAESGWPAIRPTRGALPEENLRELMRALRNSIAHCNVEFVADRNGTLAGIKLWNMNRGQLTWEARLTIQELRAVAFRFVELIEDSQPK